MPSDRSSVSPAFPDTPSDGSLVRGIGLWQATALNMIDMIGVGPFVTIPLMISTMHGPQAMLGWIFGALLVACDGLVWAELGAAMPQAGGPVRYLRAMYGPRVGGWLVIPVRLPADVQRAAVDGVRLHRLRAIHGISVAGAARHHRVAAVRAADSRSSARPPMEFTVTTGTFLAMATVAAAVFLLYRRITRDRQAWRLLWVGVIGTTLSIIFPGVTHFSPSQAFTFPAGALTLKPGSSPALAPRCSSPCTTTGATTTCVTWEGRSAIPGASSRARSCSRSLAWQRCI